MLPFLPQCLSLCLTDCLLNIARYHALCACTCMEELQEVCMQILREESWLISIVPRVILLPYHAVKSVALTCIFEQYYEHDDSHCSGVVVAWVKGEITHTDSPSLHQGHMVLLLFLTLPPTFKLL